MERSIRIGKDFNVRWSIRKVVDGERQPYELAGKELVLQYRTPYGLKEATEWKVVGNTIVWTFRGKEQKALGSYELILTENGGKDGMVTVDTCRAFKLVAHSCEETEGSGSDIVIEDVVLESEVTFAALRGPQGEQGPAGPSYDDTEIKGKLAELSEANEVLKEAQQFTDVAIKDLQDMKIDRENDDYYPNMAVGLADNLAGVDVVDSEINFRRSGGGAITDGVARIEAIKGNSVVWNQYCQSAQSLTHNGVTFTNNGDGSWTINGTAEGGTAYVVVSLSLKNKRHKWLITGLEGGSGTTYYAGDGRLISSYNGVCDTSEESVNETNIALRVVEGASVENLRVYPRIYDLTQMFGAGNEPTTIEDFYARKPMGIEDEYAYNEGEVIHMDVQSIESVGRNQWDEEWELGSISAVTGENINSATQIRSKNFNEIMGGTKYALYCSSVTNSTSRIILYDKDYKLVDYWGFTPNIARIIDVPGNVRFFKVSMDTTYGTTYNHDICINLSDTAINGQYYPYIKRVEDLSIIHKYFPDGMKSAGAAHDEIRYNKASGKKEAEARIKAIRVKDGSWLRVTVNHVEGVQVFLISPDDITSATSLAAYTDGVLMARYSMDKTGGTSTMSNKTMRRYSKNIYVRDDSYADVASFLASFNDDDFLYYELAEPIVTELDAEDQFKDLDYQVWNCGTEKAIAEGKSAPLAADITYGFNAIGKIKELENLVAALRAKVGI